MRSLTVKNEEGNTVEDEGEWTLGMMKRTLEEYCKPKKSLIMDRVGFLRIRQREGEAFNQFLLRLKKSARKCKWTEATQEDIMVLQIVKGIADISVRESLLSKAELTLTDCEKACRAAELSRVQSKEITKGGDEQLEEANAVQQRRRRISSCMFCIKGRHAAGKCPARGAVCFACGQKDHFSGSKACSKGDSSRRTGREGAGRRWRSSRKGNVKNVEEEESSEESWSEGSEEEEEETMIDLENPKQEKANKVYAMFEICQKNKTFQSRFLLDTGSNTNCCQLLQLKAQGLERYINTKSASTCKAFGGRKIKSVGKIKLTVKNPIDGKVYHDETFTVFDSPACIPLLSCRFVQKAGLLKFCYDNFDHDRVFQVSSDLREEAEEKIRKSKVPNSTKEVLLEYADVFEDRVGKFHGEMKLQVDPSLTPVRQPPRSVPLALEKSFKAELDKMVRDGIIEKVTEPCDWINSFVIERKKDKKKIRVCLDPKPLNKALKRNYHCRIPSLDDIVHKFAAHKKLKFSKVDVRSGFWHYVLDEESAKLTTFSTPYGNYRYKRLPMGVTPASSAFQMKMIEELSGLEGVDVIQDDCLIEGYGDGSAEAIQKHDKNMKKFLQRCRERGIQLNWDKCEFLADQVTYMGHILSEDGVKVDPEKVRAIKEYPVPQDMYHLQRFLGMVKYLSKFDSRLSSTCEPLYTLTRKGQPFM